MLIVFFSSLSSRRKGKLMQAGCPALLFARPAVEFRRPCIIAMFSGTKSQWAAPLTADGGKGNFCSCIRGLPKTKTQSVADVSLLLVQVARLMAARAAFAAAAPACRCNSLR